MTNGETGMRTITTREQLLINGRVHERIATHIVTGAHGYETLCTNGYNVRYNKAQQLVESCEKIAEGKLPVTCPAANDSFQKTSDIVFQNWNIILFLACY